MGIAHLFKGQASRDPLARLERTGRVNRGIHRADEENRLARVSYGISTLLLALT